MMGDEDDLWTEGDSLNDPPTLAETLIGAPRPAKDYILCPLAWLRHVLPLVRTTTQLAVLMVIYRRCLMSRSRTVALPNGELAALGISRYAKYRALAWLQDAGALTIEASNGRSTQVTLHWFP
jgi:hypothetical protein